MILTVKCINKKHKPIFEALYGMAFLGCKGALSDGEIHHGVHQ